MRILVAEDERDLNRLIAKSLAEAGYGVDRCYNGGEALDFIRAAEYDAVVLDVMMPVMSGHEVVRRMRAEGRPTPVLFLTALDSVDDRVKGLDLGADDYLIKPFAFPELLARVRAITRKYAGTKNTVLEVGGLTLDTVSRRVFREGRELSLSAKEFAILEFLLKNSGAVLSRERIENNVWNYDYDGGSNVVDVYISYLRKKIDDGFDKKLLHTVWGAGWTLKEPE
ncbi:MAG: response regulator transcription factor [bacterium]|nr:response regulator transcription factor [bacterium]